MKRTIVLALIVGALAVGGSAQASKGWSAEAPYKVAAAGACVDASGQSSCAYYMDCPTSIGCARVILKKPLAKVTIEILDASGRSTAARIYAPGAGLIGSICGKSREALFINGASELWVHPHNGTCKDSSPSIATQGVVRVTAGS